MRCPLLISLLVVTLPGCLSCPDDVDLSSPERTIESFQQAFACDEKVLEFRCFSDQVRASFNGLAGYTIGRQVFRQDNQTVILLLRLSDLGERTRIEEDADGNRATAFVDTGDGILEVALRNEPIYRLTVAGEEEFEEFAETVRVQYGPPGTVAVMIHDPDVAEAPRKPIKRIEIETRWVISGLPGLEQAVSQAGEPRP